MPSARACAAVNIGLRQKRGQQQKKNTIRFFFGRLLFVWPPAAECVRDRIYIYELAREVVGKCFNWLSDRTEM